VWRYADMFEIHSLHECLQNSSNTTSERNFTSLSLDPDCVGSIASVPRFVETARTHSSDSVEEVIFPLDAGFFIIAFCCFSANSL